MLEVRVNNAPSAYQPLQGLQSRSSQCLPFYLNHILLKEADGKQFPPLPLTHDYMYLQRANQITDRSYWLKWIQITFLRTNAPCCTRGHQHTIKYKYKLLSPAGFTKCLPSLIPCLPLVIEGVRIM